MKHIRNNKGITLIALIITIIVMLILVAVTINVALNGGIFDKASDASKKTEREKYNEQLIGLTDYDNNGYIDLEETTAQIKEEFGDDVVFNPDLGEISNSETEEVTVTIKEKYAYTL